MQYKEVIGQVHLKSQLMHSIRSGRMPHAQLFLGPKGNGKFALALATAQFLLCENRNEEDSCGECKACRKVSKLIHPDLHFSFPVIGSKSLSNHFLKEWRELILDHPYPDLQSWYKIVQAGNKQGNIPKGECMEILRKLNFKTFEGSWKILILWLPEFLGKEGNRLLKALEEPQPNTAFFLVGENQDLILNTILSRCQITRVGPIDDESMINAIIEKEQISREEATTITYLSGGDFNQALSLLADESNDHAALMLDWLRICFKGNGLKMVEWVDLFSRMGRETQKYFLDYVLHFLRELLMHKMLPSGHVRLQGKELDLVNNLDPIVQADQIDQMMELINSAYFGIERNANPKVLFLDACIRMHKIFKPKSQETSDVKSKRGSPV